MELVDWLKNFLRWKDQMDQRLKEVKVEGNLLVAVYEGKTVKYLVSSSCGKDCIVRAKSGEVQGICVENVEENFKFVISHWKEFSEMPNLCLIFVNLDLGEKWIIFPYTHSRIADPSTLEQGLRTMFDVANGKNAEVKQEKKARKMFEESEEDAEDEE
jgi:hypothetical protein